MQKKLKNKIEQGQIKPTYFKQVLHDIHGNLRHLGFRFLIFILNDSNKRLNPKFFIVSGTIDQMLRARYDIVSVPYFKKLALLL